MTESQKTVICLFWFECFLVTSVSPNVSLQPQLSEVSAKSDPPVAEGKTVRYCRKKK